MVVSKRKIVPPSCGKCGGPNRLVGMEPHAAQPRVDVLTFECEKCGAFVAIEAPLRQQAASIQNPAK
jgi:hypothetical protein